MVLKPYPSDWEAMNARRGELVSKKYQNGDPYGLTVNEQEELDRLDYARFQGILDRFSLSGNS